MATSASPANKWIEMANERSATFACRKTLNGAKCLDPIANNLKPASLH